MIIWASKIAIYFKIWLQFCMFTIICYRYWHVTLNGWPTKNKTFAILVTPLMGIYLFHKKNVPQKSVWHSGNFDSNDWYITIHFSSSFFFDPLCSSAEKSAVNNSRQFDVIMHANCSVYVCDCAHIPHLSQAANRSHCLSSSQASDFLERVQKAVEQSRNCA